MTTFASSLKLDDDAVSALKALCKETRMNPSKTIQAAVLAYRRMRANEKYLGKGELDLTGNHPDETKQMIKKSIREKHGYSA
jgi:predicted transcriptional regulator